MNIIVFQMNLNYNIHVYVSVSLDGVSCVFLIQSDSVLILLLHCQSYTVNSTNELILLKQHILSNAIYTITLLSGTSLFRMI